MTDSTNDLPDGFCTWPSCGCTARNQCRGTVSYYSAIKTADRDADPMNDPRVKALVAAAVKWRDCNDAHLIDEVIDDLSAALAAFEGDKTDD